MFRFESPLSGNLVLEKPLDYESRPLFNITIVAQVRRRHGDQVTEGGG